MFSTELKPQRPKARARKKAACCVSYQPFDGGVCTSLVTLHSVSFLTKFQIQTGDKIRENQLCAQWGCCDLKWKEEELRLSLLALVAASSFQMNGDTRPRQQGPNKPKTSKVCIFCYVVSSFFCKVFWFWNFLMLNCSELSSKYQKFPKKPNIYLKIISFW